MHPFGAKLNPAPLTNLIAILHAGMQFHTPRFPHHEISLRTGADAEIPFPGTSVFNMAALTHNSNHKWTIIGKAERQ